MTTSKLVHFRLSVSTAFKKSVTETVEWTLSGAMGDICDSRGYDVMEGAAQSNLQTTCDQASNETQLSILITSRISDSETGEIFEVSMKYSWKGNTGDLNKSGDTLTFVAEDAAQNPNLAKLQLGQAHSLSNTDTLPLNKKYSAQVKVTIP